MYIDINHRNQTGLFDLFKDDLDHHQDIINNPVKREESISTYTINESSIDLSLNCSGQLILDHINDLRRLVNLQAKEIENVGQAMTMQKSLGDKAKDVVAINIEGESLDIPKDSSAVVYPERSKRPSVGLKKNSSIFASSLLSLSDYQMNDYRVDESLLLPWIKQKFKGFGFAKKSVFVSHICGFKV